MIFSSEKIKFSFEIPALKFVEGMNEPHRNIENIVLELTCKRHIKSM